MSMHQMGLVVVLIALTLLSGVADAQGFVHASQVWLHGKLVWPEVMKSAVGFGGGMVAYWLCIRFLQALRILSPEMQTLGWFTATIIGVALFSGTFWRWHLVDQLVGTAVLLGMAWLLMRSAGSAAAGAGSTIAKAVRVPFLFRKPHVGSTSGMTQEEIAHLKERLSTVVEQLSKSQEQASQLLETVSAVQAENHVLKEQLAEASKRIEEVEKRQASAPDVVTAKVVKPQAGQKKARKKHQAQRSRR
jgi:regulator of replication initiation timing